MLKWHLNLIKKYWQRWWFLNLQVGSHYHFIEANPYLVFDRRKAHGMRLNIPAGTATRFEVKPFDCVRIEITVSDIPFQSYSMRLDKHTCLLFNVCMPHSPYVVYMKVLNSECKELQSVFVNAMLPNKLLSRSKWLHIGCCCCYTMWFVTAAKQELSASIFNQANDWENRSCFHSLMTEFMQMTFGELLSTWIIFWSLSFVIVIAFVVLLAGTYCWLSCILCHLWNLCPHIAWL